MADPVWSVDGDKIAYLDLSMASIGTINILDSKKTKIKIELDGQKLHSQLALNFEGTQYLITTEEQFKPSMQPFIIWLINNNGQSKKKLIEGSYLVAWY